ncbi:MAG: ribosomal protein L7/L12 [Bacteroidota bacterium]
METAPERVVDLIREGRKIEAVKAVREATGASLKDALHAVEEIERGTAADDPMPEVVALAREGRAVDAIALLRERTGLGLKEAKDVVDALPQPDMPGAASPMVSVAVGVALLAVGVALALLFLV